MRGKMKSKMLVIPLLVIAVALFTLVLARSRPERKEEAGSPNATESLNTQVLPPSPSPFEGVIHFNADESVPDWPPMIVPPKEAPNILLIMTDDVGFGASSTFGGTIPTPALDRIAQMGLRYTQFHSTALCSPTRAALITGRNHHTAHTGFITELATGYPGYDSIIGKDTATIGEILKQNGYATSWFGKDHNTPDWQATPIGPFDNWPIGYGFQYFCGDNGSSAEGSLIGTPNEVATFNGIEIPVKEQMKWYDVWGSDLTYPHMAVAWSWAFDTPFQWTKQVASHFGGTRQGMAIAWPKRIKDAGGIRRQFHHVIDIVPTILEAVGIPAPTMVNGVAQKPMEGVSLVYTWDKENADVPSKRKTQYFEMQGNRALYHEGWIASTTPPSPPWELGGKHLPHDVMNGYRWELYNLNEDPTQAHDLADEMPEKLREMQELFIGEAKKYQVFPLDNSTIQRVLTPRPNPAGERNILTYSGTISHLPHAVSPHLLGKSYTITAEIEIPDENAEGMLVMQGGRFGGYGFYLLKGRPVFLWNYLNLERTRWEGPQLAPGKHTLVFDFKYLGLGFGKRGMGRLKVDGQLVARKWMRRTIPFMLQWDEAFDVGIDTGSPVDDQDYQVPFKFNGKILKLTIELKPLRLRQEAEKIFMEMNRRNNRASE
jgi:arylsulfatase A-like enzyme